MSQQAVVSKLTAFVAGLLLVGCSAPPAGLAPMRPAAQFQRFASNDPAKFLQPKQPASQEELAASMVSDLYKESLADDVDNGKPFENVSQPRGGMIFETLSRLGLMRKAVYLISDGKIKKEFNKPSVPDAVPAIDSNSLAELLSVLQPGDIILCGNNDSFVHSIVYLGNDQIIHALAQLDRQGEFLGVIKETLSGYVSRVQRDKFVVLRQPGLNPQDVQQMSDYAHRQLGKSYDSLFLLSTEDRFYCTELTYQALRTVSSPARIFPHRAKYGWDLITVEDFMDSPDLQTVWTYNYTRPPAGRLHQY